MSKILITGNKGFIGTHLWDYLRGRHELIGLDLKEAKDILTSPLPDVDVVIHLAAQASVINSMRDPVKDARHNILGTIRLINYYKNTKFIFASSGGAIQETIESPYGLSKFCAEKYIEMLGYNYTILRFPNIYGPNSRSVVEKFILGPIDIWGDGSSTRDYVYVKDLIKAIEQAIGWDKGTYSLGSCKNYTVLELAQATGKKIKFSPKKEGELDHSIVPNNSPWVPKMDVVKYIKQQMKGQL